MTDPLLTVLVLAVGGNVSHGILKALALSRLSLRVIGADISPLKVGLYTVDKAYVSPWANESRFLDWLIEVCRKEGVQAVLSGAEPVLRVLSEYGAEIRQQSGALCLVNEPGLLAIGDDKFRTCEWLKARGFRTPAYALSADWDGLQELASSYGYPLVAKPRRGGGARGLLGVRDATDLEYVSKKRDYIVQEHVGNPDSEYTAGCFSDRDGRVRGTIVMWRELQEGTTVRAVVGDFPSVRAEAERIVAALKPQGPCNVQLRLRENGEPVCFEINIRFSGTTPFRARLGFNDVEAALRHYVLGEPATDLPRVTEGVVLRYWNELYADTRAYEHLCHEQVLNAPRQYGRHIEDYGVGP